MELLKGSIETLSQSFAQRMTAFENELRSTSTPQQPSVSSLSAEFQAFRDFVLATLKNLERQVAMLTSECDNAEMRSRRAMVLLHGVTETNQENPTETVLKVASQHLTAVGVIGVDISRASRLGKARSDKPRPLLIKFQSESLRDKVWMAKSNLKGSGITMSEFLTKARHRLFTAAREQLGVSRCWTSAGRILAVGGDGFADATEAKSDVPVEQLEKLKLAETKGSEQKNEHVEFHRLDSVKQNGELVSRLEEHASADAVGDGKPQVHASSKLDVPAEGIHRVLVQDGAHVSVHEATAPTTAASEEQTTKVFHGAARLVQPGSLTTNPNGHTAARRAFNADITKETKNNMDHYSSYTGVQYSPLDMAEYVFWTGDERGVTTAIEDFLQEGMMSKEEAINFLQEIKFNIDYLRAHYSQNLKSAEENAQQEQLRTMLMQQASNAKEYQYRTAAGLQSFPFGNSPDIIRSIANKNWELSNNLSPVPVLPVDMRSEPVKRYDPMLQTNIIGTSDYDRDGPIISEEEYEEMMEKLKAADTLYTEYTLEEIIYQLAKMMFSQSLSREPAAARAATQRFMAFLELEAERGQLSRTIEKKVLDVMIAALTDTIGDHPELLQTRDGLAGNSANRLMRQFLDTSAAEPSMSRAILAAYKDELLKGPPLHKMSFPDRI